ncbi:MAG TPA: RNA methyltransferase [Candidatus Polarisedimenticolia bacterium]|nr:RNA methyltransferase [Candidatus Polarisedimenticolia bacterium]
MTEPILSRKNPLFRRLRKLESEPRERRRQGMFLLWGSRLVPEAMAAPERVAHLILAQGAAGQTHPRALARLAMRHGIPVSVLADGLLEDLAAGSSDQGILALVRIQEPDPADLLEKGRDPLLLVLDRVRDPGNLGTLLRLGEAAGVRAVVLLPGTADPYQTRAGRASAGSVLRVPLLHPASSVEWRRLAEARRIRQVVTLSDGGVPPARADLKGPLALVFGNEGDGVSPELVAACDTRVTIQMGGSVESLNVAAAAAILLYEAYRQRAAK